MNHVEKKRLIKLADFLDKLPKKKFNFGSVQTGIDIPRKELDCGSVACAIGWCPVVFPKLVKYGNILNPDFEDWGEEPDRTVCSRMTKAKDYDTVAAEIFGITQNEAVALFTPNWCHDAGSPLTYLPTEATPKQVAKNIRRFIKWKEKQ